MEKGKGHPQAAQNTHGNHNDNTSHTQRLHLLAALEKKHSLTTIVARCDLDILCPLYVCSSYARWVMTLNDLDQGVTECGRKHRIARYVLRKTRTMSCDGLLRRLTHCERFSHLDAWEWAPTRFGKEASVKRYAYIGCGA